MSLRQQLTVLALAGGLFALSGVRAQPPDFPSVDRVQTLIERGNAARRMGDAISALAFFRDAINAGPRDARGYEALGRAYLSLAEPGRAQEVFEAGLRVGGGTDDLLLGLAETYRALGQSERALSAARDLATKRPELAGARQLMLEAALGLGRWVEALGAARALAVIARERPSTELDVQRLQLQVRALEKLVGRADRVHDRAQCEHPASAVRHALARCP